MALEGDLASFSLPDVLSLLSMTSKTGCLVLHRDEVVGGVSLRDGVIVGASSDDARQALARRLINAGLVDDAVLLEALHAGEPLAQAVCRLASLAPDVVQRLAREQVTDAVFDLLTWTAGGFAFEPSEVPAAVTDVTLTVTDLVAEGQRRLAAWEQLTAALPAQTSVLALNTTVEAVGELTSEEWSVLSLFDGHRSLAQALALSASGDWQTLNLLAGVVGRGLLVPVQESRSATHRATLLGRLDGAGGVPAVSSTGPAIEPAIEPVPVAPAPVVAEPVTVASAFTVAPAVEAPVELEAPRVEPVAPDVPVQNSEPGDDAAATDGGDGVDDALLQRLIAGVRAL